MTKQAISQSTASAERLLSRLLELIVSCENISDFTPTRVGRALARKLEILPDRSFGVSQKLTADWWYTLAVTPEFFLGPRVTFSFVDNEGGHSRSMHDIGRLSFDRLASRLESAGFRRTELYGEHARQRGQRFFRNGLRVEVLTRGETHAPELATPEPTAEPTPETSGGCYIWAVQVS